MTCDCHYVEFAEQVDLDSLLRHMMPYVPGMPADMALDLIREAYKVFARRTCFIVHRTLQDGQYRVREYYLTAPEGYQVHLVLGRKNIPAAAWWNGDYPLLLNDFEVIDNTLIRFSAGYSKDEKDGIELYTVLIPTDCCDTMPKSVAVPYGRGIVYGAIAEALRLPNQPFTSMRAAEQFELKFNREVANATSVALRGRKKVGLRAKPVRVC